MADNIKKSNNEPKGTFDSAAALSGNIDGQKSNINVSIEVRNSMPAPANPRRNNEDKDNED